MKNNKIREYFKKIDFVNNEPSRVLNILTLEYKIKNQEFK